MANATGDKFDAVPEVVKAAWRWLWRTLVVPGNFPLPVWRYSLIVGKDVTSRLSESVTHRLDLNRAQPPRLNSDDFVMSSLAATAPGWRKARQPARSAWS